MIVVTAPDLPQLQCAYRCPACGGIVRFEAEDLGAFGLKFVRAEGRWQVRTNCPCCRDFALFTEVTEGSTK